VSDPKLLGEWTQVQHVTARRFQCGHCGADVASISGWDNVRGGGSPGSGARDGQIRVCPLCQQPTYFRLLGHGVQLPGPLPGRAVGELPPGIGRLYQEARISHAAGAYTASVGVLRKVLMHVAVEKGAAEGLSFAAYVEYLDQQGYLGKDGKPWVDLIRERANEAAHELALMTEEVSAHVLDLAEMLLKLVYEFPAKIRPAKTP